MTISRRPDWQTALHCYLQSHEHSRFEYGTLDCCLFVCNAIRLMTGADLAAAFRGRYSSRAEALRLVRFEAGRPSVEAIAERMAAAHEMPEVPVLFAQRGDMLLIERPRDYSLGLLDLNGELLAMAANGLLRWPRARACRAWRV